MGTATEHTAHLRMTHEQLSKREYSLRYKMPAPPCIVTSPLRTWLQRHANWDRDQYVSWRVPEDLWYQESQGIGALILMF